MVDIKEIAVQATSEGVRSFVRPEDKVTLVVVTPHITSVVFERDGSEHTLQVTHWSDGMRRLYPSYKLRPGNRVEAKDYV